MQGYLTTGEAVDGLISDAELDWQTERQARFAAGNVLDAVAPTNFPLTNPAVLRAIVDEGGANLVRGARRFAADVARPPRLPQSVDTSQFEVGGNLAATPGSVVLRTEVFELIQYRPATEQVHEVPLLFVPPTINKYYILDLAPGRSLVEYLVGQGMQVFVISWRNPDEEHAHFDLDTYADAVLEARDAVATITQQPAVHVNAACSGGIITAGAVGHLAAEGALGDVASLTLVRERARQRARRHGGRLHEPRRRRGRDRGVRAPRLRGRPGAGRRVRLAAPERPRVELRRQQLPAGQDAARLRRPVLEPGRRAARRRAASRLRPARARQLARASGWADRARVAGGPGGRRRGQLHRRRPQGPHRAVGERVPEHAAARRRHQVRAVDERPHPAMVNPPAPDSRASYRVADEYPADPQAFLESAVKVPGSWWPDYAAWLAERSGAMRPAPKRLGGRGHRALGKAPGTYVYAS